jgi:hypothetical protein
MVATLVIATKLEASPCFTELSKIVRTANGRVTSHGKPISDAEIVVRSSSREILFRTKSKQDGTFYLGPDAGKYQVEVKAEGHLSFFFIVDLRSASEHSVVDVTLQSNGECHDMRVISEEEAQREDRCGSEVVSPNLTLKLATVISGRVIDETGAPFKDSAVWLKKMSGSTLQPAQVSAETCWMKPKPVAIAY